MAFAAATKLGPYEIVAPLGAGGMGEVYRALDRRLDRTVAIKVLRAGTVEEPGRRVRFEREARAIAALSHPHICAVHDVGEQDGVPFLVMEYLEGETLEERLTRGALRTGPAGALPLGEVIRIAVELTDAVAAAHEAGVVHRDLKPANVMLTPSGVKVLDFGIAKLRALRATPHDGVTESAPSDELTADGALVGTIAYMAPEQLQGQDADARTDIFALAAIVHEMATGRHPFEADTQAGRIAAILEHEPVSLTTLRPEAPPLLAHLVKACLAKDPEKRLQNARDVWHQLRWLEESAGLEASQEGAPSAAAPPRRPSWKAIGAVSILVGLASYLAMRDATRSPPAAAPTRFQIAAGAPVVDLAVSPDGRAVAYVTAPPRTPSVIWLRSLDRAEPELLPGTEGASRGLFWSPDARFLAFVSKKRLLRLAVGGGSPQDICASPSDTLTGGSWHADGTIVFSAWPPGSVFQVPASGGEARPVTELQASTGEFYHNAPTFLPATRRFLYSSGWLVEGRDDVCVGSLDGPERRCLGVQTSRFAYAPPGVLVLARRGELMAQAFDPTSLALRGEPIGLGPLVYKASGFGPAFGVGGSVLAVRSGEAGFTEQLTWYDRQGRPSGTLGAAGPIENFDLSPDGTRVAIATASPTDADAILITDIARGVTSRLEAAGRWLNDPVWSPDGRWVALSSKGGPDGATVVAKPADGGPERVIIEQRSGDVFVEDWSPDSAHLAIGLQGATGTAGALVTLRGDKPAEQRIFTEQEFPDEFQFSPDGRWLAYNAVEGGRPEVFVVPIPPTGPRWQVSAGGGAQPRWRRDGRELYYLGLDATLMAVAIGGPSRFAAAPPRPLFKTGLVVEWGYDQYEVAPDGRFLISVAVRPHEGTIIDVVLDWQVALRR